MAGQIKITLDNSDAIVCDECQNDTFIEVNYVRRISKLLIGAPEDMITNIPAFACSKCHHVNKQFQLVKPEEKEEASPIITP